MMRHIHVFRRVFFFFFYLETISYISAPVVGRRRPSSGMEPREGPSERISSPGPVPASSRLNRRPLLPTSRPPPYQLLSLGEQSRSCSCVISFNERPFFFFFFLFFFSFFFFFSKK